MFDNLAFCGNGISLRISLIITLKDTRFLQNIPEFTRKKY
jgi:hypothetical protein